MTHPKMHSKQWPGPMSVLVLIPVLVLARKVPAQTPENLARRATVSSNSEHSAAYRAGFVADGAIPAVGRCDGAGREWAVRGSSHRDDATLTFRWPEPVTVAEVVYYGRTSYAVECFDAYDVFVDDATSPIATGRLAAGHGAQRIRLPAPVRVRTLRLSFNSAHHSVNPGAAEVEVYATRPPADALIPFRPLPAGQKYYRERPAPRGPSLPEIPESAELAAAVRAGTLGFRELVVVQRHPMDPSHVYTYHAESFRGGGGLYVWSAGDGSLRELVATPTGEIIDVDVSFDGTEILFSWKRAGRNQSRYGGQDFAAEGTFQVYRIAADGTGLRQLTQGPCNNFNACWLPDGGIALLSDRKPAFAYCFTTTSPILHRMDRDGKVVQRISASYLNDFTPSVLEDGRIVYSRWEYIDRPAIPIQSLWAIHPDGTNLSGVFGNRAISPATFMEAHSIPGTGEILCVMTSHNGPCRGAIGVIDVNRGAHGQPSIRNVTPEVDIGRVDRGDGNRVRGPYESPWPLSDRHFLVSQGGTIVLRDYDRTERVVLLRARGDLGFYHARPLAPRPAPPVLRSRLPARPAGPWATVVLQDVYDGLGPGVKRGEIEQLCVIQEIEKAWRIPLCDEVPTGKGYASNCAFGFQFPLVSCGATYAAKKIWGYAPVDQDGSAHFRVPAGIPIYFAAIDKKGRAVQRMRTFTHFMPGETQSCVGCHADRNSAVSRPRALPTAAQRDPVAITPPEWGTENFRYWKVVQPVLDRHCVSCHNARVHPMGVDLSGDRTDFFSVSYDVLTRTGTVWADHPERHGARQPKTRWVSWISTANGSESNIRQIEPYRWGSPASQLAELILDGHPDAAGQPRVALSDAERRRVFAWIDLNVPYYGEARTNYPRRMGCRRVLPPAFVAVVDEVARRRCASCHEGGKVPRTFYTRVTHVEDNDVLLAPLAKSAGGTQACGQAVFANRDDPDYEAIRKVFDPIRAMLQAKPRIDMPGGPAAWEKERR